ncbi:MAG: 2-C-methyl-D-erythritol 4-phosphate cytidylyltransferase [Planctomycetota bacterium]|nr:MAG: 2-C-methyl-D-erythritol 4-phosphate cytidylyltransferase [Planctomycetota bacterium]
MPTFGVILAAAGQSNRFQDANYKKPFAPLAGRPVWLHSAEKFLERSDVRQVVVVVAPEDRESFVEKFSANLAFMGITMTEGGAHRADSVRRGLEKLDAGIDMVAIHDAARPCLATPWIDAVFSTGARTGAAILAIPVVGTLKRVGADGTIIETVDRTGLWEAQTPQVFSRQVLERAFAAAQAGAPPTDEAQLVESIGQKVTVVRGSAMNLKITSREDLALAEQTLKALPKPRLSGPSHPFADDGLWR